MARKDERGVIIPAPLQFNNPASASLLRFDDEHRGPAVADAYELSHCRIDLAERSETWPVPTILPPRMVEFAQSLPEDQRADWLRRQANIENADKMIADAMRSGDLPIWVAPIGEPERLVAPGAIIEVDRATVVSGVYRPPNDRGWLYGRPLFVKKDDWVRFAVNIEAERTVEQKPIAQSSLGKSRVGERQGISVRDALQELHQRVKAAVPDADPAPWLDVSPDLIEMFSEGDEVAFVRRKKMEKRSQLVLQRGLLSGAVQAHFSDGLASRNVPGWAWAGAERIEHVWFEGRLPLDVFLPDEWKRWSCHSVYLDRDAFTEWMDSLQLHDPADLPALPPPYDAESKPERAKKRLPPDAPFVTLSEALTWIAFGFALDRDSLDRAISGTAIDATDPEAALSDAMARLAARASGGQITARGRYVESHSTDVNKVLTEPIDPVRFEDFAKFDILYDGLRYGTGLSWANEGSALERVFQDRRDAFRSVKVSRADLLKYFPPEVDNTRALLSPLPAALPEIGAVMGMEEALSWLAHGKPSDDVQLWQNALGWLQFRYSTGEVFNVGDEEEMPAHHRRYREANRKLWSPLQNGSIAAFVQVAGAGAISVPRYYWNQVQPEHLDHAYRGMTDSDDGRGSPILLSRLAFNQWRAATASPPQSGGNVPANRSLNHAEIIKQAASMIAAQPGISKGSAAASIVADLPCNPRTGKPRDTRHIERMIAHLWEGGLS